jgi:hypothetical protein
MGDILKALERVAAMKSDLDGDKALMQCAALEIKRLRSSLRDLVEDYDGALCNDEDAPKALTQARALIGKE